MSQWSDTALELIAHRFKLLAEPSRLRLLSALFEGEKTVGDLMAITGLAQANASHQLAQLADGGLVLRRRDKCNIWYRLADPAITRICDLVLQNLQQHGEQTREALLGDRNSSASTF